MSAYDMEIRKLETSPAPKHNGGVWFQWSLICAIFYTLVFVNHEWCGRKEASRGRGREALIVTREGALEGGRQAMLHVEFKKWLCPFSLFFFPIFMSILNG